EEVGGPVQRDRCLAGAGPTLDDEDAGERAADDRILLGLDGGDDIAHPARAVAGEGGQESSLALQVRTLRIVEGVDVEHIVLDRSEERRVGKECTDRGSGCREETRESKNEDVVRD